MMTFDGLCRDFRVTAKERVELAHFLGSIRYKRTVQVLTADDAMKEAHERDLLSALRKS